MERRLEPIEKEASGGFGKTLTFWARIGARDGFIKRTAYEILSRNLCSVCLGSLLCLGSFVGRIFGMALIIESSKSCIYPFQNEVCDDGSDDVIRSRAADFLT